jgi:hypothetical protein
MARIGTAIFAWDSSAGGTTPYEHQLGAPLRALRPCLRTRGFLAEPVDLSTRSVRTVANPVHEFIGTLRYDTNQDTLHEWLSVAASHSFLYIPSSSSTGDAHECWAMVGNPINTDMDSDRGFPGYEDASLEIRLRRTDGAFTTGLYG